MVKQLTAKDMLKKAEGNIKAILADIPFIKLLDSKIEAKLDDKQVDLLFTILISGKPANLIVEIKSQGEPRLVRMAATELKDFLKGTTNSYGILVVPYFSDASRRICKEAGVGCIDLGGNTFLSFKNILIDRSGNPNPFPVSRVSKSVFSPKSSRILRVLLSDPARRWYVENLSRESGISIGLTSRVKQSLLALEWVREENKNFYLVKPEDALHQWTNNYSYKKNPAFFFYSNLAEEELEAAVKKECEKRNYRYGLALFSGARRVAPFVRFMRSFFYIDGSIEDIAVALQFRKVESGANVMLLQPYDEGVFYGLRNVNGINVVSDIQLYLDLKGYKGRGEEAAQTIYEKRIRPKW